MSKNHREIVLLSEESHVLLRPEMYVGAVSLTEEKLPIVENNNIILKSKTYSIGQHKLLDEIIDNAFDEAKRCIQLNKPMKTITVKILTEYNMVVVTDTGMGFFKGLEINKISGINNIETAFTQLRAGSNFNNDDIDTNLIGTNGVGASLVNVLSEVFQIETSDGKYKYSQSWIKFKPEPEPIIQYGKFKPGTTISFIPRTEMFNNDWDLELITTKMIFRNIIKNNDEFINQLDLKFFIDDKEINLNVNIIPKKSFLFKTNNNLKIYSWPSVEDSTSISFINGSLCTGIHQKIIQETINDRVFDYDKAHYKYETFVMLNLPPKNVKFGDQNKTKFVSSRQDIEKLLAFNITDSSLKEIKETEWYESVLYEIENSLKKEEISKLKKARKISKSKISDKYFASQKKENFILVEGNSASGSILQKRDVITDAVYALRGKVKNTKSISDLSNNKEIIDIINILDLNLEDGGSSCKFKKIIIATDADVDGYAIAGMIINFFNKWFPNIIKDGKLFKLVMPLISLESKKKIKYYYSLDEFSKEMDKKGEIKYYKGLGSFDVKAWEYIFNNLTLEKITADVNANKSLEMAFGNNSNLRKKWLMEKNNEILS